MLLLTQSNDTLSVILSWLDASDLLNCGCTCKNLLAMIFGGHNGDDDSDAKTTLCWQGAETKLTGGKFRLETITSARQHCHLFVQAAKHAKRFDQSESIPEDAKSSEMGVIALAKEFLQDTISNLEQDASQEEDIDEEPVIDWYNRTGQIFMSKMDEILQHIKRAEAEPIEPVDKSEHKSECELFVRVVRNDTDELEGQGFVTDPQTSTSRRPLSSKHLRLDLGTISDFWNIFFSTEFKNFVFDAQKNVDTMMKMMILTRWFGH